MCVCLRFTYRLLAQQHVVDQINKVVKGCHPVAVPGFANFPDFQCPFRCSLCFGFGCDCDCDAEADADGDGDCNCDG